MRLETLFYKLHELLFPKAYRMCLLRDLYLLAISDGLESSPLCNDLFAITCVKENIPQSMLRELANNPLAIKDCYPHSKGRIEKYIYLMTSMLLVEGSCSENALTHYQYTMHRLGLDDVDMIKVITALSQSNPKFQSAAISYMANVDMETLTALGKRNKPSQSKLSDQYAELIHGIIPSSADIIYVKEDNLGCSISFKMRYTDYSLTLTNIYQDKIGVSLSSSSNIKGEWKFPKFQSQASMAKKINNDIDRMICKDL